MDVKDRHILVVGLARSGFAVASALARRGAIVTVTDLKPPAVFQEFLPQLLKEKIGLELGSQRQETCLSQDAIVISPGVPWDLAQLQAARKRGIPVYPEVEAATWFLDGTLVGVTGTNGKTTTTSLLGDMLRASGFPTFVGGNIGNALSSAIDNSEPGTFFVTELSSFQLEGIQKFRPHVAVILNLSPNHLDRHPTLDAYKAAKQQIFRNQQAGDFAVLNADDPWVSSLQTSVASSPVLFSRQREVANGVFASGGKVYYRVQHLERVLFETRDVRLRGAFNLEDVLAAATAACMLGADFAAIRKAVREFKAVEHRLEFVREIQGVDFYNNSKATSVDATLKSLEAFERGIHLIMGGKDKGAPYTPLLPLITERVRDVLLIGAATPLITRDLAGSVELVPCGDLATAVVEGFKRARPGDTVLLAPACSSFDQFRDYEERGRVFKKLVGELAEVAGTSRLSQTSRGAAVVEPPPGAEAAAPPLDIPQAAPVAVPAEVEAPPAKSAPTPADAVELAPLPRKEPAAQPSPEDEQAAPPSPRDQVPDILEAVLASVEANKAAIDQPCAAASDDLEASLPAAVEGERESIAPGAAPAGSDLATGGSGELRYVYEVDSLEAPPDESQLVPEEEFVITLSSRDAEVASDEPLPFEVRTGSSHAPGSRRRGGAKSKGHPKPGPGTTDPQSRLPGLG